MFTRIYQIDNVDDLRNYISVTLCEYYELKNGAFQMTEQLLVRAGKPCGIFFCLNGPRAFDFTRHLGDRPQPDSVLRSSGRKILENPIIGGAAIGNRCRMNLDPEINVTTKCQDNRKQVQSRDTGAAETGICAEIFTVNGYSNKQRLDMP